MASDTQRLSGSRLAMIGGGIGALVVVAGALIMAQMSGCCGGAPTHGCKFIEVNDAGMDSSADAMVPCGFEICEPGKTICCLESKSEPPLRCVALNQVCKGQMASCSGDQSCPAGAGLHCCGTIATMKIQCLPFCSPDYEHDGTIRVCRSSDECPPEAPECATITVGGQSIYACLAMSASP